AMMAMELQIQVAQAVRVLNHDIHSCNRVAANQWLVEFQQTDAAWEVATTILASNSPYLQDFEVGLFAAQVLKRKIQNEGVCLQPEARNALQTALLLAAKRFSLGPPPLLTQICLALSALVLRSIELKKPIEQVFASLNELQGQGNGSSAILELLTVLPEEVIEDQKNNSTVSSARRWQFSQELLSHTTAVLDFLLHQTEDTIVDTIQRHEKNRKILRCLLSWVRVGCFMEIPKNLWPGHPLLNFVYNSLQVSSSFDLAIEVLTELVSRHEGLPQALLSRVQSFKDGLLLPALASGNEKIVGGLACLLTEIGQAAPTLIAEASPEAIALADALLRCVAYPSEDWDIADSTLQFWSGLAGYIIGMDSERGSHKHMALVMFVPLFMALLDTLLLRSQVDTSNLSADELEEEFDFPDGLAHFRMNMEELLIDICHVLGPTQFIQKLFAGPWSSLEGSIPWQDVEAKVFVLNVVAEIVLQNVQPFDYAILMQLVIILANNSSGGLKGFMCLVQKSVADALGSYSKCVCSFNNAIVPLLLFLSSGLSRPVATSACATALRRICEDASRVIAEPSNLEILIWIGEGIDKIHLPLQEEEDVICAIAIVLNAVSNIELLNKSLERLLKSSYEAIEMLLKVDSEGSFRQHSIGYAHSLESAERAFYRIGTIFTQLSPVVLPSSVGEESILLVLRQYWPLLERMLSSLHMQHCGLSVAACKSLSQAIQASGQQFSSLLPKVMDFLSTNFLSFRSHECFIRTASVVIEEFGHEEEYGSLCINTFQRFTAAESISALNSSYVCDQEPDLVEAYTSFTSTFVRFCPKEVVAAAEPLVEASVQKAAICCTAMHRGASLSAMSYMSCFLEVSLSSVLESGPCILEGSFSNVALRICSRCGEGIVSGLIYALLGVSAVTRVHKSTTILQQLAAICSASEGTNRKGTISWNSLQGWLISTVHALPAEYLKPGEAETLVPTWLKALEAAVVDYLESKKGQGGGQNHRYMQGIGRSLKQIVREFADTHRHVPPSFNIN
ncbi:hypothetical protein KI387_001160, partial [Taxus chinensis]